MIKRNIKKQDETSRDQRTQYSMMLRNVTANRCLYT